MTNLWIPAIAVVGLIACGIVWPMAIRHDRRVGDEREAAGKPRSPIPIWIVLVAAIAMIIGGNLLYNSH
ncbi:hypothetical protein G3T36_18275 [Diaminobutyricibacter tongyongensis]|uniref:Uncharacterized protein n=1 Tax=Leifsonia tongyongensis TaxID=1268043 RepID=A0A6L9Y2K5_9MICO|nr:hypothetical protein [Diaminobutyricibacter tongyongensis]NEN07806.1 hypothetical protein [Diaminobutyricibacter tongyongensis]